MFLSIIIPAYNAEKWIDRCLDSVLNQDYDDYEVIVVNDGSTDNTLNMCKLREGGGRLRLIDKPNGGVSSARNAGIEIARGEYITFVDADDVVEPNALGIIVKEIEAYAQRPSIVSLEYKIQARSGEWHSACHNEHRLLTIEEFKQAPYNISNFESACFNFYHRNVIGGNRFDTSLRMSEDTNYNAAILPYAKSILWLPIQWYCYIRNFDSATLKMQGENIFISNEMWRKKMSTLFGVNHPVLDSYVNRKIAFDYLFSIYSIYRSRGTKKKLTWLREYWKKASEGDQNWLKQLNSGLPQFCARIGSVSLPMLHVALYTIFSIEKLRRR